MYLFILGKICFCVSISHRYVIIHANDKNVFKGLMTFLRLQIRRKILCIFQNENIPPLSVKDKVSRRLPVPAALDALQSPIHDSSVNKRRSVELDCRNVKPENLAGRRLPFTDSELRVTPVKTPLKTSSENSLTKPARSFLSVWKSLDEGSAQKPGSALKRAFTEVDTSPEQAEIQAKKNNSEYKRCFPIPENDSRLHTGLTGIFSAVGLGNGGGIPNQSSPSKVTKNLLCELEEPCEYVPISGLTSSPRETRRSLSLDSDSSVHEMSVITNTPPPHGEKEALVSSFEDENETSVVTDAPPVSISQKYNEEGHHHHLHVASSSLLKSPPFLKPKNVVAFRSYCSSINRSNQSYGSRLSLASMDGMDVSTSASFQPAPMAITPVQKKRPSLNSSLYQVHTSVMTSSVPVRYRFHGNNKLAKNIDQNTSVSCPTSEQKRLCVVNMIIITKRLCVKRKTT